MSFFRNCSSTRSNLIHLGAFLLILTLFSLAACSSGGSGSDDDDGSGGGSGNANNLLSGDYQFDLIADTGSSNWNQINATTFDGSGGYDSQISYDSSGDSGTFSGTYTVGTDGVVSFAGTDIVGVAAADGSVMAVTDTDPDGTDSDISLWVALKTGSAMNAASLNGTYIIAQVRRDDERVKASRMTFTFDGAGSVGGNIIEDSDNSTGSLSGTYTVAADGEFTIDITGVTKAFEGQVASDGSLLLIMDIDDDDEVLMMVGVKTATGLDASTLSGDYQMNQFGGDSSGAWTTRIDMTADGAGSLTADILADSNDDLTDPPTMAYTVSDSGMLTITGTTQIGQVSADGEVFIIVDANTSGDDDVALTIGIKKS
jgi:hypothetical protein